MSRKIALYDADLVLAQLQHLLSIAPEHDARVTSESRRWMARAHALLNEIGHFVDANKVQAIASQIGFYQVHRPELMIDLEDAIFRAIEAASLKATPGSAGEFIPAKNEFDALAAVLRVFDRATTDLFVVDPYLDHRCLTEFASGINSGVKVRLFTDPRGHKDSLRPAVEKWVTQYGSARPLEVRLSQPGALHDRLFIIDQSEVWQCSQSLNAIAQRSPASIERSPDEPAAMKRDFYLGAWDTAAAF